MVDGFVVRVLENLWRLASLLGVVAHGKQMPVESLTYGREQTCSDHSDIICTLLTMVIKVLFENAQI